MEKIRIGILGAAGYTGGELIRVLLNHPHAQIVFANSESNAGNKVYCYKESDIPKIFSTIGRMRTDLMMK